MKSGATLSARSVNSTAASAQPVVFVDGVLESRLAVLSCSAEAPLDTRFIVLDANQGFARPTLLRQWQRAHVVIAQPMRLADEQVRWRVLGEGELEPGGRTLAAGRASRWLTLRDRWTARLDSRLARVWWSEGDGALVAQAVGQMQAGPTGNRSDQRFSFAGHAVHVLREAGQPWTLGDALMTLNGWAELDLSLALLPAEMKRAPLMQTVDLGLSVGAILQRLIEPYGLCVQREMLREGETVIERRTIRAMAHSRTVRLSRAATQNVPGQVTAAAGDEPAEAAEQWVARAAGWQVESTFELVPGWHPSLAGAPDAMYSRSTSDDFARYGNVYRYWVLNEDGRFSSTPFDRGPAFDLATFFGEGELRAQALPFRPCVTRNDAGEPRPVIVELSVDAGETWQQYPGQVVVAEHRAAIYLDDDELPAAFLAAAKAEHARVRVTASLQSPRPVEVVRWRGNPFAGVQSRRVFEVSEPFRFRRVAPTSIHKSAIEAGVLDASEIDSTRLMQQWLVERLHERAQRKSNGGRRRLTVAGLWLGLRPGDYVHDAAGTESPAVGEARPAAWVQRVHVRFDRATTELDLHHA